MPLSLTSCHFPYRTAPPLTRTTCPVMKAAAGDASHTAAAATSSGVPQRPNGVSRLVEMVYPGHVIREKGLPAEEVRSALLIAAKQSFEKGGCDLGTFKFHFHLNFQTLDVKLWASAELRDDSPLHGTKRVIGAKQANRLLEKAARDMGATEEPTQAVMSTSEATE